jgi:hypothetical protein
MRKPRSRPAALTAAQVGVTELEGLGEPPTAEAGLQAARTAAKAVRKAAQ